MPFILTFLSTISEVPENELKTRFILCILFFMYHNSSCRGEASFEFFEKFSNNIMKSLN